MKNLSALTLAILLVIPLLATPVVAHAGESDRVRHAIFVAFQSTDVFSEDYIMNARHYLVAAAKAGDRLAQKVVGADDGKALLAKSIGPTILVAYEPDSHGKLTMVGGR